MALSAALAAVPWGLFYLLRWIAPVWAGSLFSPRGWVLMQSLLSLVLLIVLGALNGCVATGPTQAQLAGNAYRQDLVRLEREFYEERRYDEGFQRQALDSLTTDLNKGVLKGYSQERINNIAIARFSRLKTEGFFRELNVLKQKYAASGIALGGQTLRSFEAQRAYLFALADRLESGAIGAKEFGTEGDREMPQIRRSEIDEFWWAAHAFRVAVWKRVDSKEISPAQGEALIAQFQLHVATERRKTRALEEQARAATKSAEASSRAAEAQATQAYDQAYWTNFWQTWKGLYQPQTQPYPLRTPINCTTEYIGKSAYTNCY